MPCCCATNVQAAIVLGIFGIIVNLVSCGNGGWGIAFGIVGALMYAILVYATYVRNHKEILIWMIIAILNCIGEVIYFIMLCVGIKGMYTDYGHTMAKTLILCGPNSNLNPK